MGSIGNDNKGSDNGVAEKLLEEFVKTAGSAVDKDLYQKCFNVHKPGITHEEMLDTYAKWAKTYDAEMCNGRYNGPIIAAEAMAAFYPEEKRATIKILDVAAGTGRVAVELKKFGFKDFDALEPCEEMLKYLLESNLYGKMIVKPIGLGQVVEIPEDAYDSLVISGGMGEGHIPVEAIDEMIRVVKPGGTIFIIMREEYLSYVGQYKGRLEPYMEEFEKQGKWKMVSRKVVPEYSFKKNGVVFCYQVL